jgi:hypothetical protein
MLIKNITNITSNLSNTTARMENMGSLIKKNMAKHDVKSAISGVMVNVRCKYTLE